MPRWRDAKPPPNSGKSSNLMPGLGDSHPERYTGWWFQTYGCQPKNRGGPPKSSILIRISIINHPFWDTPIFGNTHIYIFILFIFSGPKSWGKWSNVDERVYFSNGLKPPISNICIFIQHPIIFFGCHWFPFMADLIAWICSKIIGKGPIGEKQTLENCSNTTFERGAWSSFTYQNMLRLQPIFLFNPWK